MMNIINVKNDLNSYFLGTSDIYEIQYTNLIAGAAITLSRVSEANLFPLLSKASSGAADHTVRNKLTLGGNICGRIIYREAVRPFLLSDSQVVIAGKNGAKHVPINQVFNEKLQLEKVKYQEKILNAFYV